MRPAYPAQTRPTPAGATCAAFLHRAAAHFAALDITSIERVMTDNAMAYRRSKARKQALNDLNAQPRFTRSYRPQTNCEASWVLFRVVLTPKPTGPSALLPNCRPARKSTLPASLVSV
jgi:transposase InsO family protein